MKKLILSTLVVAMAATFSFAQQGATPQQRPQQSPDARVEKMVEKMNRDYDLTDAQKPKVKEILMKKETSREALNKQYPDRNSEEYRTAMKKVNEESMKEVNAVLTPEQIAKEKQRREEQREKRQAAHQAPPPAPTPGTTPPPPAPQPK